jgi:hypothetical protein
MGGRRGQRGSTIRFGDPKTESDTSIRYTREEFIFLSLSSEVDDGRNTD